MSDRIRWHDAETGEAAGFPGTLDIPVFRIWAPEEPGGEWMLTALFHGAHVKQCYGISTDDLKQAAERWLEEFVSSLGASFPGSDEAAHVVAAASEDIRCASTVIVDEDDAYPCHAKSSFIVARSDGDESYGINCGSDECCEEHLAETVAGMIDGDVGVHAIVSIRWEAGQ